MSQILEDVAVSFLPAASLGLTFGTNLFAGIMPVNAPDAAVAVFEYEGEAPDLTFGSLSPTFSHPRLQILVRVAEGNYLAGRNQIETIVRALESAATNATINTVQFYKMTRLQEPFLMHRDAQRHVYLCCNIAVTKALG